MVQDNPYNPYSYYAPDDLKLKSKPGILYAWKARALQYWQEKDPWKTYQAGDENKFHWTLAHLIEDPVGTVIGRTILDEAEIEARLNWKDKEEMALLLKKNSDYMRIFPVDGNKGGSNIWHPQELEKMIVHTRVTNNYQEPVELEGENHYERRTNFDLNYILHRASFGWYSYDPYESRSAGPGRTGYPGGDMIKEKPVSGPNIRGRYARDLRGDKDVLYEFTNTGSQSHLGSDLGSAGHKNAEGFLEIKNKFLYKDDLD